MASTTTLVHSSSHCVLCLQEGKSLLRCSQCKQAWYCSKEHQKKHWKTHKETCLQFIKTAESKNEQALKTLMLGSPHGATTDGTGNDSAILKDRKFASKTSRVENYQEFDLPPSPMPSSLTTEETAKRKELADLAEIVVEKLNRTGHCVVENFLGEDNSERVYEEVKALQENDLMKDGQVLAKASAERIRGDKISWITGSEADCCWIAFHMRKVDRLIRICASKLPELGIRGRTSAMVACYPGNGTAYKRHIDNPSGDGRCITTIYYLNKGWDVEKIGGQLRLYPAGKQDHTDIEPIFDRLLLFWSDRRNPHEVRPAYGVRYAITLWYFDAAERAKATKAYYDALNSKASNGNQTAPPNP